jgi:peptidoglycan hydrolase CwlO-like protein
VGEGDAQASSSPSRVARRVQTPPERSVFAGVGTSPGRLLLALGVAALIAAALLALPARAPADLQSQLSHKRSQLRDARANEVALSSAIRRYSSRIDRLSRQISRLQVREIAVQQELAVKTTELHRAEAKLARLREHLKAALRLLSQRLVAIYESNQPDTMSVILHSRGFSDLISRTQYLGAIQAQDNAIADRVTRLRNAEKATVGRLEAARAALAAERAELASTESALRDRQGSLATAQSRKQRALGHVKSTTGQLQSAISSLESKIQAQQAAAEATAGGLGVAPVLPPIAAGAIPPGQAVSPFPAGAPLVWGRTDQGVDGTTAAGTPLLAMGSGTVTIQHDPGGFGDSYPVLSTSFGDFYYGHCVPVVPDGARVSVGNQIATAHTGTWGNSTTPGGFEIGTWPPGPFGAGASIRGWLMGLPRVR